MCAYARCVGGVGVGGSERKGLGCKIMEEVGIKTLM